MPDSKQTPTQSTPFSPSSTVSAPPKTADAKATPAADAKKPTEPPKAAYTKATPAADGKKPAEPPKTADAKVAPAADAKKSAEPPKAADTKATPAADGKKSAEPSKAADAKAAPTAGPKKTADTAKTPPKGVKITQIFADRLDKPDAKALKDLPIPKEGEGYSMSLHPSYFFDFLDHPLPSTAKWMTTRNCMIPSRKTVSMSRSRHVPAQTAALNCCPATADMISPSSLIIRFR